jgi:REP element-mobilizing transposase RayT
MAAAEMKETAFRLSQVDRNVVEETVTKHCEIRSWKLHTVRARSNHVHVVVTAPGYKPETVRDQFKAWCTRLLKPGHPGRKRFWTEGGSRRWLNHEDDLEAAIIYVNEAQDCQGREIRARRASE